MKNIEYYVENFTNGDFFEVDTIQLSKDLIDFIFDKCTFISFYEDKHNRQIIAAKKWFFLYMETPGIKFPVVHMVSNNIMEIEKKFKTKFEKKRLIKLPCFYDSLKPEVEKVLGTLNIEHFETISTIDAKCSLLPYNVFFHYAMQKDIPFEYSKIVFMNRLKFRRFYNLTIERFYLYNHVRTERVTPIDHKLVVNGIYKGDIIKKSNNLYQFNGKTFYNFKEIKEWAKLRKNIS